MKQFYTVHAHLQNHSALEEIEYQIQALKSVPVNEKWETLEELKAIKHIICERKTTSHFQNVQGKTKLQQVRATYFRAQNALLEKDSELAMIEYKRISEENSELYYVKEAKKYLGEKDDCKSMDTLYASK